MKKVLVGMCVAMSVFAAQAEEAAESKASKTGAIGVFGGVTAGGDIKDDGSPVFGGQIQIPLKDNFFAEVSVALLSDETEEDGIKYELDVSSIGLSVGANADMAQNCAVYGLIGGNYNMPDDDFSIDQTRYPGAAASTDTDDAFGFHAAVGATYNVTDMLRFFIEYRYTFLELEGDLVVVRGDGAVLDTEIEGDFDFGIVKAGVNVLF